MSSHLLVGQLYVPQGCIRNPNPHVIRFSDDGVGLPIIELKNMMVEVRDGSEPAILKGVVPSRSFSFRTMWPGYADDVVESKIINAAHLTRAQLATQVAKQIANFVMVIKRHNVACPEPFKHGIVEQRICLHHIYLEGIVNTYGNCWQPLIYIYVEPSEN